MISLEDRVPKLKNIRKKKARVQLIILLAIFFLLMLLIVYFNSSYSKISDFDIKGNQLVTEEELLQWSSEAKDELFITYSTSKLEAQILKHPEIKEVHVSRQLPNQLNIEVVENKKIAYMREKKESHFTPILETSDLLTKRQTNDPESLPILVGFTDQEVLKSLTIELVELPKEITNLISEIHNTKEGQGRIHLYMNDGMKVVANIATLTKHLVHYPLYAEQFDPKVEGFLDIEVGSVFLPYDPVDVDEGDKDDEE